MEMMSPRSSWEDRSSIQPKTTSTSDQGISTSTFLLERYVVNLENKLTMSRSGSNATGGDAKPAVKLTSLTADGKTFLPMIVKYEDCFTEQEENMQAPRWSEWAEEAERMDQIAKKEKEEILA